MQAPPMDGRHSRLLVHSLFFLLVLGSLLLVLRSLLLSVDNALFVGVSGRSVDRVHLDSD